MRSLANTVFLLIVALFGLGFLVEHSLNLSRDLTETKAQLTRMQAEMQSLQAQYQAILNERNQLSDQVSQLANENTALRERLHVLDSERSALQGQITVLQRHVYLLRQASPLLTWLASLSLGRLNAALIVVPILPLSLSAAYVLRRARSTTSRPASRNPDLIQVILTREEAAFLARRRRARSA